MSMNRWATVFTCLFLSTGLALAEKAPSQNLPAGIDPGWYGQVMKDIQASEYSIAWQEQAGAYQSPNRAQNLRFTYFDDGFAAAPRAKAGDGDAWKVKMTLSSFGRTCRQAAFLPGQLMAAGDQAQAMGSGLTIRYKNGPEGMRQDFVIEQAPLDQGELMLVFSVETNSVRLESSDGQGLSFVMDQPGGAVVYSYSDMKVYDAGGQALPGRFERMGDNCFAILVDDSRAAYPVTIDPLSTSPNWTAESNQDNAHFGASVATAGDINGDGYSDVIVGAPYYDNGNTEEGRAFVYHGGPNGLFSTAAWTAESDYDYALFGKAVSAAGDINGDGYGDVVVGAEGYGGMNTGRVYVYHGSSNGLSSTANLIIESILSGSRFGASVATAGDVNNDGYSDVIVGVPSYYNGQSGEGGVCVYHGSVTGLTTTANWIAESDQASAYFGNSVATAGDVNGDGYSDVIVGAYNYDNGQTNEGRAYVYHGSASGLSAIANWTAESDQASAYFGWSVATAGDVNGDGYSDVIVGAYVYDNGQTDEGRAFVYHGSASGLSAAANWTAESDQADARFGWSVATAGDVNGDGYSDVIVGAYVYDNGQTDEGRAFVYHGSASGLSAVANWTAETDRFYDYFGRSVATAGDVNGDGYSDVIVGADYYDNGQADEGRAFVYHGSASGLSAVVNWTAESDQASSNFGNFVAAAGDVNGDGYSDVIVGAYLYDNGQTNEGRAYVYHGSASGLSAAANWTAESDQASAYYGYSVATAGDVNGDGYSDVIVGACIYDNGQINEGRAYVYHGSATGLSATAAWIAESDQASASLGYSVATAGDVNGDGYSDVIVGANLYDNGQTDEGRAYVYHGSATGLSSIAAWTAESDQASSNFGNFVAAAGDVNGDGYSDVIVGAYLYDNGQNDEGRAYVYHGSASGLSAAANWTAESDQADARFGFSVATAGDVNGDGYSDVIVGAYYYDNGQTDEGRAYVYHGSASGLFATANWTAESNQADARLGYSVAMAGDVNGDGYSDVIVGAHYYDNGQTDEGCAYVYHGSATGLPSSPNWAAESDQTSARFGTSVATAGDVNGDGYSDIIIGAYYYDNGQTDEGRAYVYYGNGGDGMDTRPRQFRADLSTPVVSTLMTHTAGQAGLGFYGRSSLGRNDVKAQFEVKPLGVPFDGTGLVETNWYDSDVTGVQISRVVSLSSYYRYKWRVRLKNRMTKCVAQPYERWVYQPYNGGLGEADFYCSDAVGPAPQISSISDIPGDQGGKLRLTWLRSVLDVTGNTYATEYTAWRRYASTKGPIVQANVKPEYERFTDDGKGYLWECLISIPVMRYSQYAYTVPTLYDSCGTGTNYEVYRVIIHTTNPDVYFISPTDSGYSVDNLAPAKVLNLAGSVQEPAKGDHYVNLHWNPDAEYDLSHYSIHRDLSSGFVPGPGNLFKTATDTTARDTIPDGTYFYRVCAVDIHGNVGLASNEFATGTLAVQLSLLAAGELEDGRVAIKWRTESEQNSLRWDVERSGDPYAGFRLLGSVPGRGSTSQPADYRYDDGSVPAAGTYYYRLGQVDLDGSRRYYGPVSVDCLGRVPRADGLAMARPNPFRGSTAIDYQLTGNKQVRLGVYNVYGQLVRTLARGTQPAGYHRANWDGRNDAGRMVSAGVYLVRLEAEDFTKSARVTVVR